MRISNNISSKPFNTFGINAPISTLIEIQSIQDLHFLDSKKAYRVLGGGSNILITNELKDNVLLIDIKGKDIIKDSEKYVLIKVGAGENWHHTVLWALDNEFGGIENLSLIPGKCGAAPMQNIGAYGVEIKDVLHSIYCYDLHMKQEFTFHHSECGFDYRTSHFKTSWKDRFIITSIVLKLSKAPFHVINTTYGAIQSQLTEKGIINPGIREVSNTVIEIRQSKLPDPSIVGNAGSFFKNPIVSNEKYLGIKALFSDIVAYPSSGKKKLAAGWLIDNCGWKGFEDPSGAGTYGKQALVIINNGNASGNDILAFSKRISESVYEKYGVELEPEVNIWP